MKIWLGLMFAHALSPQTDAVVRCCGDEICFDAATLLECQAELLSLAGDTVAPEIVDESLCGLHDSFVVGRPDETYIIVDSCDVPQTSLLGQPEILCLIRTLDKDSLAPSGESFLTLWPRFSMRSEGWHRSFRDPVPSCSFAIRFDPLQTDDVQSIFPVIFAAEPLNEDACTN